MIRCIHHAHSYFPVFEHIGGHDMEKRNTKEFYIRLRKGHPEPLRAWGTNRLKRLFNES